MNDFVPRKSANDAASYPPLSDQVFVRSRSVVSRQVAGETLIVPIRGKVGDLASIYSFNETGSLIWQMLENPKRLVELIEVVEAEYSVECEQAEHDATQFLNDMLAVGLVEACPSVPVNAMGLSEREELTAGAD
jgi:hypothetical protein